MSDNIEKEQERQRESLGHCLKTVDYMWWDACHKQGIWNLPLRECCDAILKVNERADGLADGPSWIWLNWDREHWLKQDPIEFCKELYDYLIEIWENSDEEEEE